MRRDDTRLARRVRDMRRTLTARTFDGGHDGWSTILPSNVRARGGRRLEGAGVVEAASSDFFFFMGACER